MGRPLKEESVLSHDIKVRIDSATNEKLSKYCEENGKGKAEVIREAVKEYLKD